MPKDVYGIWLGFAAALVILDLLFSSQLVTHPVSQFHFIVALVLLSCWPLIMLFSRRQFEVQRWQDSDFSPYAGSDE